MGWGFGSNASDAEQELKPARERRARRSSVVDDGAARARSMRPRRWRPSIGWWPARRRTV